MIRPRRVEQARALLVIQAFLLLVALLAVTLSLQVAAGLELSDRQSNALLALLATLATAAALGGLAARFVRREHWVGWILGLLAQVAVVLATVEAVLVGAMYATPAIVVLASAGWVTAVLLRPEVRGHLLRRRRQVRTPGR